MRITKTLILKKIEYLEKEYGFTDRIGTAQVQGKSEAINREYGKYEALLELLED